MQGGALLSIRVAVVAQPLVLERVPEAEQGQPDGPLSWIHTKALYRLTDYSRPMLRGCSDEMCSTASDPMATMTNTNDTPY